MGTIGITTRPAFTSIPASMSGSCTNGYQTWLVSANPNMSNATNFHWTVDNPSNGYYNIQSPNSQSTYITVSGGGGVSVTYVDQCGDISAKDGVTIYSPCGRSGAIAVYPNPANNELNVQYKTVNSTEQPTTENSVTNNTTIDGFNVELYNDKGKILKSGQSGNSNKSIILNTSDITNGIYYLHVKQGGDLIEKQIIIQH